MITGNQAVPKGRYEIPIAIPAETFDALHDIRDTLALHKVSEVTTRQCEHVLDALTIVNQALDNLQNDIANAYKNAAECPEEPKGPPSDEEDKLHQWATKIAAIIVYNKKCLDNGYSPVSVASHLIFDLEYMLK